MPGWNIIAACPDDALYGAARVSPGGISAFCVAEGDPGALGGKKIGTCLPRPQARIGIDGRSLRPDLWPEVVQRAVPCLGFPIEAGRHADGRLLYTRSDAGLVGDGDALRVARPIAASGKAVGKHVFRRSFPGRAYTTDQDRRDQRRGQRHSQSRVFMR